jgi:uncharacterized Zn finger protein (UPF0148 family)
MAQQFCKACGTELIPGKEFCPKCLVRVPKVVSADPMPLKVPKEVIKKLLCRNPIKSGLYRGPKDLRYNVSFS